MNIENYFETDEFYESLEPLKNVFAKYDERDKLNVIEYIIDKAIKYSILFKDKPDNKDLTKFIKNISQKINNMPRGEYLTFYIETKVSDYVKDLFKEEVLDYFNIDKNRPLSKEEYDLLQTKIVTAINGNEYKYHAFNSVFLESIKKYGINPNIKFTPQEEIDEIHSIFLKYGEKMIFGWQKLNCEDKVSFSDTTEVSYYYGTGSPEWFSQFTGQTFAYNPDKYDKYAFAINDVEKARKNLMDLMESQNFTYEDMKKVMAFFEKNWELYANHEPIIAIIPNKNPNFNNYISFIKDEFTDPEELENLIHFCQGGYGVDQHTKDPIDVSNAIFVRLPRLDQLEKRLLSEKKQELTVEQKLSILKNSRIRIKTNEDGLQTWESENGEEELEQVRQILNDDEVYKTIISNENNREILLFDGWISYFSKEIINNPENVKLLALHKPIYFGYVDEELKKDINLMKECVSQKGIKPIFLNYVDENARSNSEFIYKVIINSSENEFDFYGKSVLSLPNSQMNYGKIIGIDIQTNPLFWEFLNAKIDKINQNKNTNIPHFDVEKEISIAILEKETSPKRK